MLIAKDHNVRTLVVDPGGATSAAYAECTDGLRDITLHNLNDETEFIDHVKKISDAYPVNAVLEQIPKFAGRDVPASRIFPLARNYGFVEGVFRGLGIPLVQYTLQKWMAQVPGLKKKGMTYADRKRAIRNHFATLYPELKPTLRQADALGLAHHHFS